MTTAAATSINTASINTANVNGGPSAPPIWLNGRLSPADAARLDPADRGLLLGDGLFETLRLQDGILLRLPQHWARMAAGAAIIGLPLPCAAADIAAAAADLIAAAGVRDGSMRLTVTRGVGPRGLPPPKSPSPTIMLTIGGLPPETAMRLITAQSTRRNEHSPLSRIKSLNYLDNVLSRMEADQAGADDALMLNTAGRVAESTVANLFWAKDGALFTPPIAEGALPGVRRALVSKTLGATEKPLTLEELRAADAAILVNSLSVRALAALDGAPIGDGGDALAVVARAVQSDEN